MNVSETDLSDSYIGEAYEGGVRTDTQTHLPSAGEILSHWLRLYRTYEKPCGCTFWSSRSRLHPENFEETDVLGSRTVVEERRVFSERVEDRTIEVAVCNCTRCGEQFEVKIPGTEFAHSQPAEDAPEVEVEGEWEMQP